VLSDTPLAASRLLARLRSLGFLPAPKEAGSPRKVALTPEHAVHEQAVVPVGRCLTFVLAAGPGVSGVELRLTDSSSGAEIALGRGAVSASARACSIDRPGPLELDVRLRAITGSADALLASHLTTPGG
jgi:hypothetical protein